MIYGIDWDTSVLFVIRRSWINAHSRRICYIFQAFLKYISTVALCQTEELSGDNSPNFYWLSLNQPCFWTDVVVWSCLCIKGHATAFIVFYFFYYTSLSFRVGRVKYAVEVILYYCIHVYWFVLCLSSFLFLLSIKESFAFSLFFISLFHLTWVSIALVTDPSNDGAGALFVLLRPLLYAVADSFAVRR